MPELLWRGVEVESLERARVEERDGVRASSAIDSARGRYGYELVCDADWTFRRLHLEALAGHRALDLERAPDPQRYTRLGERLYRYESLDSDFERDVIVDAAGFVVEYPGLFERL